MGRRWDESVKRFIGKNAMVTDHDGNKFFGIVDAILYNYGKVILLEEDGSSKEVDAIYINNVANIRILKDDYLQESKDEDINGVLNLNTVVVKVKEKEFPDTVAC